MDEYVRRGTRRAGVKPFLHDLAGVRQRSASSNGRSSSHNLKKDLHWFEDVEILRRDDESVIVLDWVRLLEAIESGKWLPVSK